MGDTEEEFVFGKLNELTVNELIIVNDQLKLPAIEEGKKIKSSVMKVILKYLSSDGVENSDDQGLAHFLWIKEFIEKKDIKVEAKSNPEDREHLREVKRENSKDITDFSAGNLKSVLKKDFKIRGTIGLPGQKDKLTFSSLAYQIESGVKKKYTEDELCEEVVRAVSPDLQLRSFLEGKADLTLQSLRRILRAHFQEQDPTTLFNSLSNSSQQSTETALDFVIRLMNLRQKILFVSKEVDNRFEYSEPLLQKQFLHSVVTGLRNESVKNEIKPLLLTDNLSDEELLEFLNKAVSDEKERQLKMKKQISKVDALSTSDEIRTDKDKKDKKDNPVLNELKELRVQLNEVSTLKSEIEQLKKQIYEKPIPRGNEISTLKSEIEQLKKQIYEKPHSRVRFRGRTMKCATCKQNKVERCTHCVLCGSLNHFKAQCDKNSEN